MKKNSGTEINYDLKNETLKFAVKIPIDFLRDLIILIQVFSYMKGGDNSKKDKEIKRKKMEHRLRYNPAVSYEKAGP